MKARSDVSVPLNGDDSQDYEVKNQQKRDCRRAVPRTVPLQEQTRPKPGVVYFWLDKSLHMCKTAFLLTLSACFIAIFTTDPLPFGLYLLDTPCSHLIQSRACVNPGYFRFISEPCISAPLFWEAERAVCEEPE